MDSSFRKTGFAHRAIKDIVWKGQFIPAGATVIGSNWAISRDPVAFPDPDTFKPLRWLTEDGTIKKDIHSASAGGFVPVNMLRIGHCISTWLYLLWSFRILQKSEAPIDTEQIQDGIASHPKRFEAEFVPRAEERKLRRLMTEEWAA